MPNRSTASALFYLLPIAIISTLALPLRNSALPILAFVPAGSTINVSVSVQAPPAGVTLSYRWRATDGTVVDVNAPATTWTLPAGQGQHFLYVQVSNGQGGYTEQRFGVTTTDTLATAPAVVSGAPRPTVPKAPPSGSGLGIFRAWLPDQRPDVLLEAVDTTITPPTVYGPVSTDLQGQFTFFNLPQDSFQLLLSDAPGRSFRPSVNSSVFGTSIAVSEYNSFTSIPAFLPTSLDEIGNTIVAGHVALQDGSLCGAVDKLFGTEVAATATLLNSSKAIVAGPVRVNTPGYYQLDASLPSSGSYSVQVACENLPVLTVAVPVVVTAGSTNIYRSVNFLFPSSPPVITGFSATLVGVPVLISGATQTSLPSDDYPGGNRFLTTKGVDSKAGACRYYLAIGAVASCDSSGNPSGGIDFDVWKQQSGLAPYNTAGETQATFVNMVDLNLTRIHHAVQNGTDVAMYVCNYPGPSDPTNQAQVDTAITNAQNNSGLVACVAMDYTTLPGVNNGQPFTRFFTFGPSGNLLLSINLDGRGEKFMPGACVACHAGDNYAGHFPTDGSGAANIGARFLPFDEANFAFSDQSGLTLSSQAAAIHALNNLTLKTNPTSSLTNLISGWYSNSSNPNLQVNSYMPTYWKSSPPASQAMYSTVIEHSCRTCHIAQTAWDLDGFLSQGDASQPLCGGNQAALWASHTMPNSKTVFDRVWQSQGRANDQIATVNAWFQAFNATFPVCALTTPDPAGVPYLSNNATSFPTPAWLNVTSTHAGDFRRSHAASYNVVVSNLGAAKTSTTVTVTETVPAGFTLVSIGGTGWNCPGGSTCTRGDALSVGASYPPLTVGVFVGLSVAPQVTNQVTAYWGASVGVSASDVTLISPLGPCDVQQIGSFSVAGLQLVINEALGVTPAINDLNGDHVVNAVLGLGCAAQ
jgi:hypothetical protein